jgi:tetratricopeptide (TPR) repeat protein
VSTTHRVRSQRILREAEGYLELGLAQAALDALDRLTEPGTFRGKLMYLRGEALRSLHRYDEASDALQQAADLRPSEPDVWLALAWCQKRSGQLDKAIEALEHAREGEPSEATIYYNLACYYSLAGRKDDAIANLSRAIAMKPDFREMVSDEADFDPIRSDPEFQAIISVIV